MKLLGTFNQGVANLVVNRLNLVATLGGYELWFGIEGLTVTPTTPYWLAAHSAEIQVGGAQGQLSRLGVARPSAPLRISTGPSALQVIWEFRLPVTAHHLSVIESLRNAGDLQFKLVISGEGGRVERPGPIEGVHDELHHIVGQSDWVRELNGAKAMDILLLEIAMPFVDPPRPLAAAIQQLRSDQQLFAQGNYTQSVGSCREAMDSLKAFEGREEDWKSKACASRSAGPAKEMTKEERELVLEAALHEFVHIGAHSAKVQMNRQDAKLAIAVTASVLAYRVG